MGETVHRALLLVGIGRSVPVRIASTTASDSPPLIASGLCAYHSNSDPQTLAVVMIARSGSFGPSVVENRR
jgi:hypothetical protein